MQLHDYNLAQKAEVGEKIDGNFHDEDDDALVVDEQLPGDPSRVVVDQEDGEESDQSKECVEVEHNRKRKTWDDLKKFVCGGERSCRSFRLGASGWRCRGRCCLAGRRRRTCASAGR